MDTMTTPAGAGFSYEQFQKIAPGALAALLAMSKAVDDSGLEKALTELVKIRISQINGCAFCIQFHLQIARRIGIDAIKLDLVTAWRDAGVYSDREMAALEWAEHVTKLADHHSDDSAYAVLHEHFSSGEVLNLTVAIANINAWNRIAGALHFPPLSLQKG